MREARITNENVYELTARGSTLSLIRVPGVTWDDEDKENYLDDEYWIYEPSVDGRVFAEILRLEYPIGSDAGTLISGFAENGELAVCLNAMLLLTDAGLGVGRIPLFGSQLSKSGMVVSVQVTELQDHFVWSELRHEILPGDFTVPGKIEPSYAAFRNIGPFRFAKDQYVKAIMDCMP